MKNTKITAAKLAKKLSEKISIRVLDNDSKEPLVGIFLGEMLLTTVFLSNKSVIITDFKKIRISKEDFFKNDVSLIVTVKNKRKKT